MQQKNWIDANGNKVGNIIHTNGTTIINPTREQLISLGCQESVEEISEKNLTYEERVVSLIRERYTIDDELAILRQRDSKQQEFSDYYVYCEQCKQIAKNETDFNVTDK